MRWPIVLGLLLAVAPAAADNGAIAIGYPIDPPAIDGDLSDWPGDAARYPIANGGVEAHFRVGYDLESESLFVALSVTDDDHWVDGSEWMRRDAHILYIDPVHSVRGSAPWPLVASTGHHERLTQEDSWDPRARQGEWENMEVAVGRSGRTTTYEWRIGLGEAVAAGRTLGLDHVVLDVDQEGNDIRHGWWGRFGDKTGRLARCGDLLLVDPARGLGTLRGSQAWAEGVDGPDLSGYRYRITSTASPEMWLQPETDAEGAFEIKLPPGEYRLSAAFPMYGENFEHRVRDDAAVVATVKRNAVTDAPPLRLTTVNDLPEQGEPLLFELTAERIAAIDRFVEARMDHYQIPGVSLALVHDGQIAHTRSFGVANYLTEEPVTDATLFEAGSITKIFFAFAVNRLAERGVIDLDRPLHLYLPFEDIDHDPRYERITARHVLSHRTGFPNWARYNDNGKIDIKFIPGTGFRYSGEAFEYLKRVVVKLTGKPIDTILREETLKPLGIAGELAFFDDGSLRGRIAMGHDMTRPNMPYLPDEVGVAHSLHTPARPLAEMIVGLLERRGLEAATYDAMLTPITYAYPTQDIGWPAYFGLGFQLRESPFGMTFGHGGSNHSNESLLEIYPEQRSGFVVLTNSDAGTRLYQELRRFLVGELLH